MNKKMTRRARGRKCNAGRAVAEGEDSPAIAAIAAKLNPAKPQAECCKSARRESGFEN
jgi:hypothetical protein